MKPTDISQRVKEIVWNRDSKCCVVCGKPLPKHFANAHVFVRRSHFGLGIPENIVTLCQTHHHWLDSGLDWQHKYVKEIVYEHMYKQYPDLDIEKLKEGIE